MLSHRKKHESPEYDKPLKILTSNPAEIAEQVESTDDFSYDKAFGNSKVLVIGDTDHSNAKIVGSLAGSIDEMAASGVKKFLIEIPKNPDALSAIEELNSNGNAEKLSAHLDQYSMNPLQLLRLFKGLHEKGIEIVPIDMPFAMRKDFENTDISKERSIYMGNEIAKHCSNLEGRAVVFCGLYHLNLDQIPAVLKSKSIDYKSAALVTEHQPSTTAFFGMPLAELGICQYVESKNRSGRSTLVTLNGSLGIDCVLCLRWESGKPDNRATDSTSSCIEFKTGMEKDVYADFSNCVEPDSKLWKNTNLDKIVNTMELFGDSLNEFQKFYLSMSLSMYLELTLQKGGGSIVDIKYDSKDKAFKIRTVDTFHYKYLKDVDYGSLMRYREVTLGMLLSQYSIPKSVLNDESAFRDAVGRIKIEPKTKAAAYKLIFMSLVSGSGIGSIKGSSEGIYLESPNGKNLLAVNLDEIKLDKRTSEALDASREILEWSLAAQEAIGNIVVGESKVGRRTKRALQKILEIDGMMNPMHFFLDGIARRASKSYAQFKPVSDSEFLSMANDFIEKASVLEGFVKSARDVLPEGTYKEFNMDSMLISKKRFISKAPGIIEVKTILDSCINVLEANKAKMVRITENENFDPYVLRR